MKTFISSRCGLTLARWGQTLKSMSCFLLVLDISYDHYHQANQIHVFLTCNIKALKNICWMHPPMGYTKLNDDGAYKVGLIRGGSRGLVKGERENWLFCFSKHLGSCNTYTSELWVSVICSLQLNSLGSPLSVSLGKKIKKLLQEDWEVEISHVYYEANQCAHVLASMGCRQEINLLIMGVLSVSCFNFS